MDVEVTQAAESLAIQICGCATREQRKADVAAILALEQSAFAAGRKAGLMEAAKIAREGARFCRSTYTVTADGVAHQPLADEARGWRDAATAIEERANSGT